MNKKILTSLVTLGLLSQLSASEMTHEKHSDFYIVAKTLTIAGDKVDHGHGITLDGDRGYGVGLDFGYRLGNGFSIEYDFSYAKNSLSEDDGHGHIEEADAIYYTNALDIVYTYHITHTFGVFAKLGYSYEKEEIDDLHIESEENGAVVAGGIEYSLNNHYTLLAEYEHADIEGPRGDSVFLGVMYNF